MLQMLSSPLRVHSPKRADLVYVPLYAHKIMQLQTELKSPNK